MTLILCVDDRGGLSFNGRRQSQDRRVREDLLTMAAGGALWMDDYSRRQFTELRQYIRFEAGNIILGEAGNEITLRIENDRVSFLDAGAEVAYFSDKQLHVLDGRFLNWLRIGAFAWIPRANGNLSLVKVGD